MSLLVYGFKPYADYKENISEKVIAEIPGSDRVRKAVFDIRFSRRMFAAVLQRSSPDVIIGLGQHPRARKLRIERKAVNLWKNGNMGPKSIAPLGPKYRYSNLGLPLTSEVTVAYDAGSYLCNYSMYVVAEYCERHAARFAFIHVPQNYKLAKVTRYVCHAMDAILLE